MNKTWELKENICWVGDSIIASGGFVNNIWRYLLFKYPQMKINFRNCGTPGDNTKHVINRFEYDIMTKKPEQAVIMLGMNDSSVGIYNEKYEISKEHNDKVVDEYNKNIRNLICMFEKRGVDIILCTPTPFDDTAELEAENHKGRNEILGRFAQIIKDIAQEKSLLVVDFWNEITMYNKKFQNINPKFTLSGLDRVHPDDVGHCVMAYIFLKSTGHLIDNDAFIIKTSKKLTDVIQKKQEVEGKLRNMNMIKGAIYEMGYENSQYEEFKIKYIKTLEGKWYCDFCVDKLRLYETNIDNEKDMENEVEQLIKVVNDVERIEC